MTLLLPNRRGLITGLASLVVTAPAIVRAASLMPVKTVVWPEPLRPLFTDSHRGFYKLVGHKVVKCGLHEWAMAFDISRRHIGDTWVNGRRVSTVFLGIDHSYLWSSKGPVVFETMVFGPGGDKEHGQELAMSRYCTYDEAERGHQDMVARVKAIGGMEQP